MTMLFKQLN